MKRPQYSDLGDLPEDERIQIIGSRAIDHGEKVGFFVGDEPGKPERYIKKLREQFPAIQILYRGKGPIPGTVFITVGPQTAVN